MDSIGRHFAAPASSRREALRAPSGDGLRRLAIGLDTVALIARLGIFLVVLLFATTLLRGVLPASVLRGFLLLYVAPPAFALVALVDRLAALWAACHGPFGRGFVARRRNGGLRLRLTRPTWLQS